MNKEDKLWPSDDEVSLRYPIYTRANAGEVFQRPASPLTWSLYGRTVYEAGFRDAFYEMGVFTPGDFEPEGTCEVEGAFGGYPYLNASVSRVFAVRTPGMTPQSMDLAFFGEASSVIPYEAQEGDTNRDCTDAMTEWLESLFATSSVPELDAHQKMVWSIVNNRPDLTGLDDHELAARFRWLAPQLRQVYATHIVNTYACNILAGTLAQAAAEADRVDLVAPITAGIGGVESAQQSFHLWDVSRLARRESVAAEFEVGDLTTLVNRLENRVEDADCRAFVSAWHTFMDEWSFVGPNVWEFRSPTYGSNPELPLSMVDRLRQVEDDNAPGVRANELEGQRQRAIDELYGLIGEPTRAEQMRSAAHVASIYMPARESTKTMCTRLCDEARLAIRELGTRLVVRGHVDAWQDLLLVLDDELDSFLRDPASWDEVIRERRSQLGLLESLTPPFVVYGKTPSLEDFVRPNDALAQTRPAGAVLTGVGTSPGRYTGTARVVADLHGGEVLQPGEILVAQTTDSSWGPLFMSAGAVVCQTGSTVSHSAIVARELGIPAVSSVPECTTAIPSGASVTVDGFEGTVTVN